MRIRSSAAVRYQPPLAPLPDEWPPELELLLELELDELDDWMRGVDR